MCQVTEVNCEALKHLDLRSAFVRTMNHCSMIKFHFPSTTFTIVAVQTEFLAGRGLFEGNYMTYQY